MNMLYWSCLVYDYEEVRALAHLQCERQDYIHPAARAGKRVYTDGHAFVRLP